MAVESAKARISNIPDGLTKQELAILMANMVDALQAITAKLDLDAGVTDTNYAAILATYITD